MEDISAHALTFLVSGRLLRLKVDMLFLVNQYPSCLSSKQEIVDIPNTSTLVNGEWDERKLELEHRVRCLEKEKSVLQEEVLQLHKHVCWR